MESTRINKVLFSRFIRISYSSKTKSFIELAVQYYLYCLFSLDLFVENVENCLLRSDPKRRINKFANMRNPILE